MPRLRRSELTREVATVDTREEALRTADGGGVEGGMLLLHALPCNGILYVDVMLDLSAASGEESGA